MKDFSGESFKYAGKKYTFQVILASMDDTIKLSLDNQYLKTFEYESELNNLIQRGSIEYTDKYGRIDKLIDNCGAYCDILLVQNELKFDNDIVIEKYSDVNRFDGRFLIENIGILERRGDEVDYKIDLVSINVFKCQSVVDYSNYESGEQPVFDILRACLVKAGFQPDKDTFDNVKTPVSMRYITNGNDTVLTIIKYLFNKLYYYDRDDSLKFILWNETFSRPQLFDVKDKATFTGSYDVVLSLLRSRHESLISEEPNQLATITRLPTSRNIEMVFDTNVFDYDYSKNQFVNKQITSKQLSQYFNKRFEPDLALIDKQYPVSSSDGNNYVRRQAYWNNSINYYDDMVKILTKNNALLIETTGEILRKPGSVINVFIDRDTSEVTTEDRKKLDDLMSRYSGLEGPWFAARVHHYVYPQEGRYRQWIALARNYIIQS